MLTRLCAITCHKLERLKFLEVFKKELSICIHSHALSAQQYATSQLGMPLQVLRFHQIAGGSHFSEYQFRLGLNSGICCVKDIAMLINNNKVFINPLSANLTKWPNAIKQFVGKFPTNCLSVFDHFVKLTLKGLIIRLAVKIFTKEIDYCRFFHFFKGRNIQANKVMFLFIGRNFSFYGHHLLL